LKPHQLVQSDAKRFVLIYVMKFTDMYRNFTYSTGWAKTTGPVLKASPTAAVPATHYGDCTASQQCYSQTQS